MLLLRLSHGLHLVHMAWERVDVPTLALVQSSLSHFADLAAEACQKDLTFPFLAFASLEVEAI